MTDETLPGLEENTPPAAPFIKTLLSEGLIAYDRMELPPADAAAALATNADVEALYAPWHRDLHDFLWAATLAHVLIRLEENHPNLAAGIAREVDQFLDAGDAYPEWIWEWATDRGLNPDEIIADARAKHEAWLASAPRKFTTRRGAAAVAGAR